ncbi:MAG: signal peptide peptidase SppA [Polyangiaceae bacterium]|nr:signal peptide peptidase SppA [Polyangiaceae bacterium]
MSRGDRRASRARRLAAWVAAGAALTAGASACDGRPRGSGAAPAASASASGRGELVEIDLTASTPESPAAGLFTAPASRTFVGLVRTFERLRGDDRVGSIYVRLGERSPSWAQVEEIARELAKLRTSGKRVTCHAHSLSNSALWLFAEGCDRRWLSPAGDADAVGIAGQTLHVKGAFDKLGVQAEFLHMGRYKSAAETFTHERPSAEAVESLGGTLASIRDSWRTSVASARGEGMASALEQGPFPATEAKARGLVDEIGYESDALGEARQAAGTETLRPGFGPRAAVGGGFDVAELVRILSGADDAEGGRPRLVVVPLVGSIAMSGGGILDEAGITVKPVTRTLRKLAKDDSVKAVVLRIDSPGGSALASDLLWHEIDELAKKKPVVASLGDTAASGGYYLAVAARHVIAERTTILGSIGVVGGKIVVGPALARFGVNAVTVPASPEPGAAARAAWLSPFESWDDPTRERVHAQMRAIYELFLDRVARGRKLPLDTVRQIAEGRIWSGAQGKERGLVDQLGGLGDALSRARELGELDAEAPVSVEGVAASLLELLALDGPDDASEERVAEALGRLARRRAELDLLLPAGDRALVAPLAPMLAGEVVLAALPFGVTVR